MSQGRTGCRKEGIQETEVLAAHLESQLGWVGWSQTADPWSLFLLSWLVLSASQGCMCVHITHSFWKLSLPRSLEGHLFSLYGIWMESRNPKSSKHWRADHPTPTSPAFPTPPPVLPIHLPFIPFCPLSIPFLALCQLYFHPYHRTPADIVHMYWCAFPLSERNTFLGGGKGVETEILSVLLSVETPVSWSGPGPEWAVSEYVESTCSRHLPTLFA